MRVKGQVVLLVLLFLLIIGLAILGYLVYVNLPGDPIELAVKNVHSSSNPLVNQGGNLTRSVQFYPRMRFKDRIITYDIDSGCSSDKRSQVTRSFYSLEEKTSLKFVLDFNQPDIEVTCSQVAPPSSDAGHFVAGEGGPYEVLNVSSYVIILSSKISLYRDDTCSSPHIALHEILHALGFDHNNNPSSILYPTLDCNQVVDDYFADEINKLYLEDSLPDLSIVALNGTKAGRYLSFSISVSNLGLADSQDSSLSLIADDGSLVKDFDLGIIQLGATKILTVTNLAAPRASKSFKFIVNRNNLVRELDTTNNDASLILES